MTRNLLAVALAAAVPGVITMALRCRGVSEVWWLNQAFGLVCGVFLTWDAAEALLRDPNSYVRRLARVAIGTVIFVFHVHIMFAR